MLKKVFGNSTIYSIVEFLNKGMFVFFLPILTHYLSTEEYGVLDTSIIFFSIASVFLTVELYQANSRYIPENIDDENYVLTHFSTSIWYILFSYVVFGVFILFFNEKLSLALFDNVKYSSLLLVVLLYSFTTNMSSQFIYLFKWRAEAKRVSVASLLNSSIAILSTIILLTKTSLVLEAYFVGFTIGNIVTIAYCYKYLNRFLFFRFDIPVFKKLINYSFPLIFSTLFFLLSIFIDRIFINYFLDLKTLGIYASAYRVAALSSLLIVGFQSSFVPLFYQNLKREKLKSEVNLLFKLFVLLASLIIMIYEIYSNFLVSILLDNKFYESWRYIVIISISIFLFKTHAFSPGMSISFKTHYIAILTFIAFSINCILNYFFIPMFGAIGAAYSTLIAGFVFFSINLIVSQRLYFINYDLTKIGVYFLAVLTLVFIGYYYFPEPSWDIVLVKSLIMIWITVLGFNALFAKEETALIKEIFTK